MLGRNTTKFTTLVLQIDISSITKINSNRHLSCVEVAPITFTPTSS